MKKYANRPALRAVEVWFRIVKGMDIHVIGKSVIFHLNRGCHLTQRWLKEQDGKVIVMHARTYLRKGIFLVPIWQNVPNWQLDWLREHDIPFTKDVIVLHGENFQRLTYMQVEDIDHVIRQVDHTVNGYLNTLDFAKYFAKFWEKLDQRENIVLRLNDRKAAAEGLKRHIEGKLKVVRMSVGSILANAPTFNGSFYEHDAQTAANGLIKHAENLASITFRPVFFRTGYASRMILSAVKDLKDSELIGAQAHLTMALKSIDKTINLF